MIGIGGDTYWRQLKAIGYEIVTRVQAKGYSATLLFGLPNPEAPVLYPPGYFPIQNYSD